MPRDDTANWTETELDELRHEFGDRYDGRTCLVTGADGFMGSHLTEALAHHHDFDEEGGLILHERSPINPKSIYATSKVAADFLTMNYHDAFGLPGVVTRMFNNYGPRQNPRYVTGTIITQALEREQIELGQLEPMRDFCFCTDGVRGHLTVAAKGIPGDVYVYGQGKNISMQAWADMIIRVGREGG